MVEPMIQEAPTPAFTAPGPGFWELETTHHGLRPLTHLVRGAYVRSFEAGISTMLERYGLPLLTVRPALVDGCMYVRPVAVGEGKKPSTSVPPTFVLKVLAKVHPELRRRSRTASRALAERTWRVEVDHWFDHERDELLHRNLELQGVDPASLDDAALAAHLAACLAGFEDGMRRNMETHGGDIVPVGDLLAHGEGWGIDHATMGALLVGASPATVETATLLRPVAVALAATDRAVSSIDDVRALGPDVAAAVDTWLERHGWRLVMSDDVDRPALAELPALQLRALLAATDSVVASPDPAPVRARVPAGERELFDSLLEEARYGHRQRDDVRGLCWNWPGGLVRRAMLEAGRRLVSSGRLRDAEHAAELVPDEIDALLGRGDGPDADAVARRAAERDRIEAAPPPRSFGEPELEPPLDAFPPAMARFTHAVMACLVADVAPAAEPLHGLGIGDRPYRGRACVVRDAWEALESVEPGDVLIAQFTGPSFNSVLPVLGALVVEEGGAMCHAAIVARDYGVPAIIGAAGAMAIPDGAIVEVDPLAGVVRVVDSLRDDGDGAATG